MFSVPHVLNLLNMFEDNVLEIEIRSITVNSVFKIQILKLKKNNNNKILYFLYFLFPLLNKF